jgi:LacI family transcriptional regulator, galactose operon repressor
MAGSRKRATLREVAEATGLSTAAVSYALRGLQVSKETEKRVKQAAAELGYEADPIARALASGRTSMVGLLSGSLEDLWQQQLFFSLGRELLHKDRYALILDAGGDPARELTLARQLRDQRVDGLIVSPLDPSAHAWAELADSLPVVSIGDSLSNARAAGAVLFDNRAGVTLALEHLSRLGHQRIAVLTTTRPSTPDRPADTYVLEEGARLALDLQVLAAPQSVTEAEAVAHKALVAPHRPTALFCFSDSIAYGGYAAARALGLTIPTDVSVVGYDDHPVSRLLSPTLTTVDWDLESIIRAAVQLVITAIDGRPRRRRIVKPPNLRERDSTGRPRRG